MGKAIVRKYGKRGIKSSNQVFLQRKFFGGSMTEIMEALSHGKGFVKCYQYDERINGKMFVNFIEQFVNMFWKGDHKYSKLINLDGDFFENCKLSKKEVKKVGCR